jgi:hypothetical protein
MKRIKSLRQHIDTCELKESLIQKGFAVSQRARFLSNKSSLKSKLSNLKSVLKSAQMNSNPEIQIKSLLTAFIIFADVIDDQSEMLTNIQNLVVASNLFLEGTKK